jgi:CBS-domain-containing membrane protein
MRVKDIMEATPSLIRTTDTFEHLIKTLNEVKYHVVFVVDNEGHLVGVVTEADLIKVLVPKYLSFDKFLISAMNENYFENKCVESRALPVTEIMTKTVLSVQADDTVIHAASLMVMNKVRTLPVMDDGKVVGTVHLINLIQHIMEILQEAGAVRGSSV